MAIMKKVYKVQTESMNITALQMTFGWKIQNIIPIATK